MVSGVSREQIRLLKPGVEGAVPTAYFPRPAVRLPFGSIRLPSGFSTATLLAQYGYPPALVLLPSA